MTVRVSDHERRPPAGVPQKMRLKPYIFPDGEGGQQMRLTLADGTIHVFDIDDAWALRTIAELALHLRRRLAPGHRDRSGGPRPAGGGG